MNNYTKTYIYTLRTKEKWYISNSMQIYHLNIYVSFENYFFLT